jgi:hypothetical protein
VPIPTAAANPARRPRTAAVRTTYIVSRPGVMVRSAANTAKESTEAITRSSLIAPVPEMILDYVARGAVEDYSTVTDLARFRGWSTSCFRVRAISAAKICNGTVVISGASSVGVLGT